jgi:outer membrane protein assembly factor BamB
VFQPSESFVASFVGSFVDKARDKACDKDPASRGIQKQGESVRRSIHSRTPTRTRESLVLLLFCLLLSLLPVYRSVGADVQTNALGAALAKATPLAEGGELVKAAELVNQVLGKQKVPRAEMTAALTFYRDYRLYAEGAAALRLQAALCDTNDLAFVKREEARHLDRSGDLDAALRVLESLASGAGPGLSERERAEVQTELDRSRSVQKLAEAVIIPEPVGLNDTLGAIRRRAEAGDPGPAGPALVKLIKAQREQVVIAKSGMGLEAADFIRQEVAAWPQVIQDALNSELEQEAGTAAVKLPQSDLRKLGEFWLLHHGTKAAAAAVERTADRLLDEGRADLASRLYGRLRLDAPSPVLVSKHAFATGLTARVQAASAPQASATAARSWAAAVSPVERLYINSSRSGPYYRGDLVEILPVPVAAGSVLYVNNGRCLRRYEAVTGSNVWTTPFVPDIADEIGGGRIGGGGHWPAPRMPPPVFGALVHDDLVICRHAGLATTAGYLIWTGLSAVDAASGAVRWSTRDNPELKGQHVASEPSLSGGILHVLMRNSAIDDATVRAVALEVRTGRVVWNRVLCIGPDGSRDLDYNSELLAFELPPPLATERGVFFATHMGRMFFLDPLSGAVVWMRRYLQSPDDGTVRGTPVSPALMKGGTIEVAPRDSCRIYALEAATGKLVLDKPAGRQAWKPAATSVGQSHAVVGAGFPRFAEASQGKPDRPSFVGDPALAPGKLRPAVEPTGLIAPRLLWRTVTPLFNVSIPDENRGLLLFWGRYAARMVHAEGFGETLWEFSSRSPLSQFVWAGETLVAVTDEAVVGLDQASGAERWRIPGIGPNFSVFLIQGDLFCIGLPKVSELIRINPADGSVRWRCVAPAGQTFGGSYSPSILRETGGQSYVVTRPEREPQSNWSLIRLGADGKLGQTVCVRPADGSGFFDLTAERVYLTKAGQGTSCWDPSLKQKFWTLKINPHYDEPFERAPDRRILPAPDGGRPLWISRPPRSELDNPPRVVLDPLTGERCYEGDGSRWNSSILKTVGIELSRINIGRGKKPQMAWAVKLPSGRDEACRWFLPETGAALGVIRATGAPWDPPHSLRYDVLDPASGKVLARRMLGWTRDIVDRAEWKYANSRIFVTAGRELLCYQAAAPGGEAAWFAGRRQAALRVADPAERVKALRCANMSEQIFREAELTWTPAGGPLKLDQAWQWLPGAGDGDLRFSDWGGVQDLSCVATAVTNADFAVRLTIDVRDDVWTPLSRDRGDAVILEKYGKRLAIGLDALYLPVVIGEDGADSAAIRVSQAVRISQDVVRYVIEVPGAWQADPYRMDDKALRFFLGLAIRDDDGAGVEGVLNWGGPASRSVVRFE